MRLTAGLALGALALLIAGLWATGSFQAIAWWAAQRQHTLQSALAASIQDLRGGQPAAFWSLILLCGGYGFVHALGPGHGKVLITGAAIGSRATALRMCAIAVAGSLAQAAVAVLIVYGGFALFQATARGTVAASETWIAPAGNLAIAAIGGWILIRGLRSLPAGRPHTHGAHCGHAYGPTPDQAARANGLGAALALIGGMAARPCTGALVVLVIAWRFGLPASGIAAVFAMGLGTAAFTVLIALAAVAGRDAAFVSVGDGRLARLLLPGLQIGAGGLILGISLILLRGAAPQ